MTRLRHDGPIRLLRQTAAALCVGGLGGGLFAILGIPAPFLAGPAVAATLAILAGARLEIPVPLRNAGFLILGIGIGTSVTPEVLRAAATWPWSFAVMAVALMATLAACNALLEAGFGFDRVSALLAATPGHLSYALGLSVHLHADLDRIAIVQSIRVLVLTVLVPALVTLWGVEGDAPVAVAPLMGPMAVLVVGMVSVAVARVLSRAGLPAAWLLGAMLVSGLAHGAELAPGRLPDGLILGAFIVMGTLIGTRFRGQTPADLRRNLGAGLAATLIACGAAALGALAVAELLGLSPVLLADRLRAGRGGGDGGDGDPDRRGPDLRRRPSRLPPADPDGADPDLRAARPAADLSRAARENGGPPGDPPLIVSSCRPGGAQAALSAADLAFWVAPSALAAALSATSSPAFWACSAVSCPAFWVTSAKFCAVRMNRSICFCAKSL